MITLNCPKQTIQTNATSLYLSLTDVTITRTVFLENCNNWQLAEQLNAELLRWPREPEPRTTYVSAKASNPVDYSAARDGVVWRLQQVHVLSLVQDTKIQEKEQDIRGTRN